jgi:hypothetical protein
VALALIIYGMHQEDKGVMIWSISLVVKAISSEFGTLYGHSQFKRPMTNDDAVAIEPSKDST